MNTRIISILTALLLLPSISIAQFRNEQGSAQMQQKKLPYAGETVKSKEGQYGKAATKCAGAHFIKLCFPNGTCGKTVECETDQYCIGPQAMAPAKPSVIKEAQCVKPDAIGEATCADSGSQKLELVVKGITVPVLEKCPALKPICVLGKCAANGEVVCSDNDNTNYAKLLKWNQEGKEKSLSSDISVIKSGKVTIASVADPTGAKSYPDKCKGSTLLLEQACDGGVAKEIGVNCSEAKGCLNPGADGICKGFTWSVPDGTCKVDKIENSNDLAARCSLKDADNDGISDNTDNCVDVVNQDQKDSDGDKLGDVCDNCPANANLDQMDVDQDKIGDICDNCKFAPNQNQADANGDAIGDSCQIGMVSAGDLYGCALKIDGTVWCWGANAYGKIGDGTDYGIKTLPVKVINLNNVSAITARGEVSCALKKDGTMWCWGWGDWGQLGDGTKESKSAPVQFFGLTDIIKVSAHTYVSCGLKNNGTIWCSGMGGGGKLGDGTSEDKSMPVQVKNLTNAVDITVGEHYSCAIKKDNTVWCWGSSFQGELEDGDSDGTKSTPTQVKGLSKVISVAIGWMHTCVLKMDGTVWCWGSNYAGQLGDGSLETKLTATQVKSLNNVIAIEANLSWTCAVRSDGTVWCWGRNDDVLPGMGYKINSSTPVKIEGISNAVGITVGSDHACVLKSDASIWCWGNSNKYGQLGNGTQVDSTTPVEVKF